MDQFLYLRFLFLFAAWIGSLSCGLLFLSAVAAIKVCDITSVTSTLLIGAILSGSGLILTSVVTRFEALYFSYGVLFGVGTSFLYTPCLIMIGRWFYRYQSVTIGLAAASASLGAVVLSPLTQHMIATAGLRRAIQACGIAYLTIAIVCSLCFRPFSQHQQQEKQRQKQRQQLQQHLDANQELPNLDATEPSDIHQNPCKDSDEALRQNFAVNCALFHSKKFVMFLVVMMISNFTYYVPIIHLVSFLF